MDTSDRRRQQRMDDAVARVQRENIELLRKSPVVVLPAAVSDFQVAECLRAWSPDVTRTAHAVRTLDAYELHGPINYSEATWQAAGLPVEYPQAYALTGRSDGMDERQPEGGSESIGYDGLCGVARRLAGLVRPMHGGEGWQQPYGEAPNPWAFSPVELPPDHTLRLLEPHLPGLRLEFHDEITGEYRLDTDGVIVWVNPCVPTIFPLVRAQPWFATADRTTEHQFHADPATDAPAQVATAARALAAATRGVVLDEDGYPWPDGHRS